MCIRDRQNPQKLEISEDGTVEMEIKSMTEPDNILPENQSIFLSIKMCIRDRVKRPATATTSKASESVKTNVIKERPLSSGASDRKATQSADVYKRQGRYLLLSRL